MRQRLSFAIWLFAVPVFSETGGGTTGGSHQQNPYMMMQALNGDKTAKMMMMMNGGMGGGGGGNNKYQSKSAEIQKSIEQPAKEVQKRADESLKSYTAATDKMVSETAKFFQSNTAKDEKIDEKLAGQISVLPPSNSKMMQEATNELIASTKSLSDSASQAARSQSLIFLNAAPPLELQKPSMGQRLGWGSASVSDGSLASTVPARRTDSLEGAGVSNPTLDHSPGANAGNRIPGGQGFASGLVHNPPRGF